MINKILGGFSKSDTKIMRKPLLSKFFFNFFHFLCIFIENSLSFRTFVLCSRIIGCTETKWLGGISCKKMKNSTLQRNFEVGRLSAVSVPSTFF